MTLEEIKAKYGNVVLKLDTYFWGEKYSLISLKGRKGGKEIVVTWKDKEFKSDVINEFCPTLNQYGVKPWQILLDNETIYGGKEDANL